MNRMSLPRYVSPEASIAAFSEGCPIGLPSIHLTNYSVFVKLMVYFENKY